MYSDNSQTIILIGLLDCIEYLSKENVKANCIKLFNDAWNGFYYIYYIYYIYNAKVSPIINAIDFSSAQQQFVAFITFVFHLAY